MMQRLTGRKTLAMFILAFLCLNVGGAFCLTYCSQIAMATPVVADAHLSEHCRKAKQVAEERNKDTSRVDADEASCSMLPVALFSAPVEKRTIMSDVVMTEAAPPAVFRYSAPTVASVTTTAIPVYRPPPLDHRVDRILHCVIRI